MCVSDGECDDECDGDCCGDCDGVVDCDCDYERDCACEGCLWKQHLALQYPIVLVDKWHIVSTTIEIA